ncbi:MAG: glycosyltransferase family 2 protein [Flavobacteriales bacterium]|nr:glycosyltransferase family 2 protein [Flavobacteriales bacterium]
MKKDVISIIMPVRNGGAYLKEAIESVLNQTYAKWELLIVDNGSTDGTVGVLHGYRDQRIVLLSELEKVGVGYARNTALRVMNGEFFCCLDADDRLTDESLKLRFDLFRADPEIAFVDGYVETWDVAFKQLKSVCKPSFKGNPFDELVSLSGRCMCANSWMVRRKAGYDYRFEEGWTHAEDLAFYLSIGLQGAYDFVKHPIYQIRRGHVSAMSNIEGLSKGYEKILLKMKKLNVEGTRVDRARRRIRSMMTKSFLKHGDLGKALGEWIKFGPKKG